MAKYLFVFLLGTGFGVWVDRYGVSGAIDKVTEKAKKGVGEAQRFADEAKKEADRAAAEKAKKK